MTDVAEFLAMGGYAAFVWPAYGVAAVVLLLLLVATVRGLKERETTLKALEGARPPRRRARRDTAAPAAGIPPSQAKVSEG